MVGGVATLGQVIRNPATGETVTFLTTTADSNGALLGIEMVADPSGGGVSEHLHPKLTERHELLQGRLHVRLRGEERVLEAPAGGFESFLETVYALATDGKTNAKGMPNLLQSAVIAREHLDDYALPKLPLWLQKALFGVLAPAGRLAGYKARYP